MRQRFRGLADAEIVYTPIEADVGVSILGFENQLESGHRTGYSASILTYDPCKGTMGDEEWQTRIVNNHFMVTAATVPEIIDAVVSDVDTNDIESKRSLHAAIKKAQPPK